MERDTDTGDKTNLAVLKVRPRSDVPTPFISYTAAQNPATVHLQKNVFLGGVLPFQDVCPVHKVLLVASPSISPLSPKPHIPNIP
jgi:hypothetical protein